MKFSPIEASETITKKYKRYLKTAFEIADPDYAGQFDKELNVQDIFATENTFFNGLYGKQVLNKPCDIEFVEMPV